MPVIPAIAALLLPIASTDTALDPGPEQPLPALTARPAPSALLDDPRPPEPFYDPTAAQGWVLPALASFQDTPTSAAETDPGTNLTGDVDEATPAWGTPDTWRWTLQLAGGVEVQDTRNAVGMVGVGFEYYIDRQFSFDFELNAIYVGQTGDNAIGATAAALARWHFVSRDTWSIFVEGGVGMSLTSASVPIDGTNFNFTPQAGVGFTTDIGNDVRLIASVRWFHMSNANLSRDNPARDSVILWLGLSMPFR